MSLAPLSISSHDREGGDTLSPADWTIRQPSNKTRNVCSCTLQADEEILYSIFDRVIGRGQYCSVVAGMRSLISQNKQTIETSHVAIKIPAPDKNACTIHNGVHLLREISILLHMNKIQNGMFAVRLLDILPALILTTTISCSSSSSCNKNKISSVANPGRSLIEFESTMLVLEKMTCSLHQWLLLQSIPAKDLQQLRKSVMYQLARALSYLQASGIMHRDLKPDNILIRSSDFQRHCEVKLADFGMATAFSSSVEGGEQQLTDLVVSQPYRAPELLFGLRDSYTCAIDVWSMGIVFLEVFMGRSFPLFLGNTIHEQIGMLLPYIGMPDTSVNGCLAERPSSAQALERWERFQKSIPCCKNNNTTAATKSWGAFLNLDSGDEDTTVFVDLLDKMLRRDPQQRLTAQQVLEHPWFAKSSYGEPVLFKESDVAHLADVAVYPAALRQLLHTWYRQPLQVPMTIFYAQVRTVLLWLMAQVRHDAANLVSKLCRLAGKREEGGQSAESSFEEDCAWETVLPKIDVYLLAKELLLMSL